MEPIVFLSEDGEEQEFYVECETRINGRDYLLVTTSEEEDAEALILKDISEDSDEEAEFVLVDDEEAEALLKVFEQMLDEDTQIQG